MQIDAPDLRKELVQVAAVAVAIIRDMDTGSTRLEAMDELMADGEVFATVAKERLRQYKKWGNQSHNPVEWLIILMEEFGEASSVVQQMVPDFYPEENTITPRHEDARMVLAYASSMEARARKWLQAHDWPDPQHKDIHEEEAESDA